MQKAQKAQEILTKWRTWLIRYGSSAWWQSNQAESWSWRDLWRTCAKNVTQMKPGDCAGWQRAGGVAQADRRQKVDWGSWSWSPTCGNRTRISGEHAHVNCHFSPNKKYVEIIGWTFMKADEKLNYRLIEWLSEKLYLVVLLNVKERNLSHGHFALEAFCFVCNNAI